MTLSPSFSQQQQLNDNNNNTHIRDVTDSEFNRIRHFFRNPISVGYLKFDLEMGVPHFNALTGGDPLLISG